MRSRANIVVGVLVGVVLLVAVALIAFPRAPETGTLRALVHDSDGRTFELDLSHDDTLEVTTSLGTNIVVVEGGGVYVREADCDNHDCVRQGRIDAPGKQIICLPHKLWIEVLAEGAEAGEMDEGLAASAGEADELDVVAR